jgi:general secretion pathway protein G
MQQQKHHLFKQQAGFSLLEIIIVIAIIASLSAVVVVNVVAQQEKANIQQTEIQLKNLGTPLGLYRNDNRSYPTTEEGLDALVDNPGTARNWRGPYVDDENNIVDLWFTPIEYERVGSKYKLSSAGPDGEMGTEDDIIVPKPKGGEG